MHIDELPHEMLQNIFTFLPRLKDRKSASLVCHRWESLVFNFSYLSRVQLNVDMGNVQEVLNVVRDYHNISLRFNGDLDVEQIATTLSHFNSSNLFLQRLVRGDSSESFLLLNIVARCPSVKRLQLELYETVRDEGNSINECFQDVISIAQAVGTRIVRNWLKFAQCLGLPASACGGNQNSQTNAGTHDKVPTVESLEELSIRGTFSINITHLAPNLRTLQVYSEYHDLSSAIAKLPLEHLRVTFPYADVFTKCSNATKLTTVTLIGKCIDQETLEQLRTYCPLLTKLRIRASRADLSLQCLASLMHLKVLSLCNVDPDLFVIMNTEICLPNIEVLELHVWATLHIRPFMRRIFPNVHYLHYRTDCMPTMAADFSDGFPQLKTLELSNEIPYEITSLHRLSELSNLHELVVHDLELSGDQIPPMNLQQLSLEGSSVLKVTDQLALNLPKLQYLNLYDESKCINAINLPSCSTVRRYPEKTLNEIFVF